MKKSRIITATALFDGHDASINIFRKIMQKMGQEVIHLGHNRSVEEIVTSAVQEQADAILISSYQGGHNEFFRYLIDLLKEKKAENILVFGGGGGVILPDEIQELEAYGVTRLYHANTGKEIGIQGIADDIVSRLREKTDKVSLAKFLHDLAGENLDTANKLLISKYISAFENYQGESQLEKLRTDLQTTAADASVIGITGTGGSGKSSLTDELVTRFLKVSPDATIGILSVDPTKSTTGGALLGDRIRMNSIFNDRIYMRSFATRGSSSELSDALSDAILVLKSAGFDIIIVETSGIGQGDSGIIKLSQYSIYVMTSDFGAPTQLDKIDMLDLADFVVINKCDHVGAEDALREVVLRYIKNKGIKVQHRSRQTLFELDLPIYATNASQFNNHGVNQLFHELMIRVSENGTRSQVDDQMLSLLPTQEHKRFEALHRQKTSYLAEIADTIQKYHAQVEEEMKHAETCYSAKNVLMALNEDDADSALKSRLQQLNDDTWQKLAPATQLFLEQWPETKKTYQQKEISYTVRGKEIKVKTTNESLCGSAIPKVALPQYHSWADLVCFFYNENLPGYFPFTAGVFPFKRTFEDPKRQFAGEGAPERTNKRFHYLTRNDRAKRLSVAFDGLTLYGADPDEKPDIYGKIGESGVSICTLDDMKKLLDGFDVTDPYTSVSMTINGPASIILAMYFMTGVSQQEEKLGRKLSQTERIELFQKYRGTVQADMLKEDQAQNTCIFSIDFALKLMGDVQKFFSQNQIRNYYAISISGYHIAEAGANPITQLAFTLANGFHYVEYFSSLGLEIDDFAQNLSFFFSNGMDPEYAVIGRVARRIWAIALRDKYGANEKSQKLKYHIQTSGRSLHAQEIDLNDIRTTCQALLAFYDNCNSLHTNSYDEAVTTPTEESVRRAMAIQMIVSKEMGLLKNENPNQGSFLIEELTSLVEKAVLDEFYRISYRGGVTGAMERQYQRAKVQEESLYYEELKHSGEYPIIGVNTFLPETEQPDPYQDMELSRATATEKDQRLKDLAEFKARNQEHSKTALLALRKVVLTGGNIFEELLNTVQYVSLGEITQLLYELGGKYRRNI